jgi:hypothetical protein
LASVVFIVLGCEKVIVCAVRAVKVNDAMELASLYVESSAIVALTRHDPVEAFAVTVLPETEQFPLTSS